MRCKCIKTYVPSIPEGSFNFYFISDRLLIDTNDGYVVDDRFILSKEIFDEYFLDCAEVRNELLELIGI